MIFFTTFAPNGTCLWVEAPDYYMEVDCPDKDNMNARFEADGKIINKLFPYMLPIHRKAQDIATTARTSSAMRLQ